MKKQDEVNQSINPVYEGLTKAQRYTAAGLLGVIVTSTLTNGIVPTHIVICGAIGLGIGSTAAVALYRVADLMKNGKAEVNPFGNGIWAGVAVAFGMTAIQTIPQILQGNYIQGATPFSTTIAGLAGIGAGFFQSRSTFVTQTIADGAAVVSAER